MIIILFFNPGDLYLLGLQK